MEECILTRQNTSIAIDVVIVLLISFAAIEIFSITGWATGITSFLPSPVGFFSSLVLISLSLCSAFGLLIKRIFWLYSALLSSVCMIVLSGFAVASINTKSDGSLSLLASSFTGLIFGVLLVFLVFRSNPAEKNKILTNNDPDRSSNSFEYAIELHKVTKKYYLGQNVVAAVKDLDLNIKKGEFVAIMGPSGSGKSTLLNLIGALDKPSSGEIAIDGVDISGLNENQLARLRNEKIGFIFQAYNLVARSRVMRNMELPALVKGYSREEREERAIMLLNMVNLFEKTLRKPKTLSGGEQQRVAIARALMNDPEIILADEPTGNVDSKTGQTIMGLLRKLNTTKKTTVIVVTHDEGVARRADRIIFFRDGTILKEEATTVGNPT